MTAIALRSVSVSLGGAPIVHNVTASVEPGEWLTLIGPNGAGKSTLLRAIAQLVPFEGSIRLDDREVSALGRKALARKIAFVPQSPQLQFYLLRTKEAGQHRARRNQNAY